MTKADTALKTIPTPGNGERDQWITITAAYKAAGGRFDVWDAWSQRGGGYSQRDAKDVGFGNRKQKTGIEIDAIPKKKAIE